MKLSTVALAVFAVTFSGSWAQDHCLSVCRHRCDEAYVICSITPAYDFCNKAKEVCYDACDEGCKCLSTCKSTECVLGESADDLLFIFRNMFNHAKQFVCRAKCNTQCGFNTGFDTAFYYFWPAGKPVKSLTKPARKA